MFLNPDYSALWKWPIKGLDIFQVKDFRVPGISHCPALNPHLESPLILWGDFTSMSFEPVSSYSFSTPITFLKLPRHFHTYSCFEALTLAIPSTRNTRSLIPTCLAWPCICVSTQTSPPPGGLSHVTPSFIFFLALITIWDSYSFDKQTPHELSSKREKESKLTRKK